jgi:hypothetical protein
MKWVIVVGPVITPGPSEFNSDRCHRPWVNVSTNESEGKRPANHKENHSQPSVHAVRVERSRRYNMETVLIVLVVLFLLGGGGWGYSRWRA